MKSKARSVIHLGDAGKGAITCGAKEARTALTKNWTWRPGGVTCKRCLTMYNADLRRRFR